MMVLDWLQYVLESIAWVVWIALMLGRSGRVALQPPANEERLVIRPLPRPAARVHLAACWSSPPGGG
jgi:hypothetical protein